MISFKVSRKEAELINEIARRADRELCGPASIDQSALDTTMDLSACIAQGCPLRLDELLVADLGNFGHDVAGIRRHLNRETGKLENCFLPRFAAVRGVKADGMIFDDASDEDVSK